MRVFRYLALLAILIVPATYAHSQISIGIGIGGPVYYAAPVCPYGYYGYAPYACAPYGYYGPAWFSRGVFIGAGPWSRGGYGYRRVAPYRSYYVNPGYYGHPRYGYTPRDYDGRHGDFHDRDGWRGGGHDRGHGRGRGHR